MSDYKRLRRLTNKRNHAIDTWEKNPTEKNLNIILLFVKLLSNLIKSMNVKR